MYIWSSVLSSQVLIMTFEFTSIYTLTEFETFRVLRNDLIQILPSQQNTWSKERLTVSCELTEAELRIVSRHHLGAVSRARWCICQKATVLTRRQGPATQ